MVGGRKMEFKKTLTKNPFVDEIVYTTKIMTYGTVLKDQDEADKMETAAMARNADLYVACRTNQERFEIMQFARADLVQLGLTDTSSEKYPNGQINACLEDKYNIPKSVRDEAVQICKTRILANYLEINNYYRMLNGLPNINEDGIYIDESVISDPEIIIDTTVPIHMMSNSEIAVLEDDGIIGKLIEEYPEKKYLRHLGSKRIDIVTARKADKFDVLYVPAIDFEDLRQKFIDRLEHNKHYVKRCIYSEAMKIGSEDYYDKFMELFIVLMSAIDLLSEVQIAIAKKDVFNVRSIQYIFSSFGIPYYEEIPIKYQINMMKNLNKLIKYKATSINMIDICSLFGFPDISVFKYYILKDRRFDKETQDYIFSFNEDGSENLDAEYELKFVKVPIDEEPDQYIKDPNNYLDYHTITTNDRYWAEGGTISEKVRREILEKEFNIMRSKYISIDSTTELTKIAFNLPYFFNMLYDDVKLEEQLKLSVPYISNTTAFRFTDIFILIFALGYMYNGIKDSIMDTTGKILYILGFNFKADLGELASYIADKGYTLEDLGVSDFIIPTSSILSYNQLLEIFTKNSEIHKHVTKAMVDADDKNIYDIYKKIYDSLMIMRFTNDYFKIPGSNVTAHTYTEFLRYRDQTLYKVLSDLDNIGETIEGATATTIMNEKRKEIDKYIEAIVVAMQEYIDSDKFAFVYSNLPGETADYIQKYIMKVISFFKSYKVDFIGMNTIYMLDDQFENLIRAIDKIDSINIKFFWNEYPLPEEQIKTIVTAGYKEKVTPLEDIFYTTLRHIFKMMDDRYYNMDDRIQMTATVHPKDSYEITDSMVFESYLV